MNFFEQQAQAQATTTKLVWLFVLAVATLIVVTGGLALVVYSIVHAQPGQPFTLANVQWQSEVFGGVAVVVGVVILLGALFRTSQLRSGGRVVAESMGGKLVQQQDCSPDERKILNVVEEMAIAAGVPVPPVYLIKDDAINAFAAGFRPQDAVIGITSGAIRHLGRDELQGVIAHEFSHIFNGDMRLNLRLIGWLHGLLLIALIGRMLLRIRPSSRGRRGKGGGGLVLLGLGMLVLGYVGVLFGNLIKAAVSRQREFLADASAVQYTRNPGGIGNALKKIGGFPLGSRLLQHEVAEVSHMLFGESVSRFSFGLFATHPPLSERIKRIEPRWDGELINPEKPRDIAFSQLPPESTAAKQTADAFNKADTLSTVLIAAAGATSEASLRAARLQLQALSAATKEQLAVPLEATLRLYAVLIAASVPATAALQQTLLKARLPRETFNRFAEIFEQAKTCERSQDLLIVELAQPALNQLSVAQLTEFLLLVRELVDIDGELSLHEWTVSALLQHNLREASATSGTRVDLQQCHKPIQLLLSALAKAGHDDSTLALNAFIQGSGTLGLTLSFEPPSHWRALDAAIASLQSLKPLQKPALLKAMVACVHHDGRVSPNEMCLLRVVAALLDCPLPPV